MLFVKVLAAPGALLSMSTICTAYPQLLQESTRVEPTCPCSSFSKHCWVSLLKTTDRMQFDLGIRLLRTVFIKRFAAMCVMFVVDLDCV